MADQGTNWKEGNLRNTEIEYTSSDRMHDVLLEMERLLPPLCEEQSLLLKSDIPANEGYTPINVNEYIVINDGHNRFSLRNEILSNDCLYKEKTVVCQNIGLS